MVELYFLLIRLPKIMSRLAKERNRSAVGWSLIAILAWLGAESIVLFCYVFVLVIGEDRWGWRERPPIFLGLFAYVLALAAAVVGAEVVRQVLTSLPTHEPPPPLPPKF
jgi:hypothetical protein